MKQTSSIAGTVPLIGDLLKRLLRAGESIGRLTLSRFFITHVALLPAALLVIGVHVIAFRRFGSVGPWRDTQRQRHSPFWPDQACKDVLVASLVLVLLVTLSVYAPPPITGSADPVDTSYVPKPEWNFLFLYEALKFFPGRLEPLGTVGLPLLGILLLVSLPFLDRRPEWHPARRPLAMTGAGLVTTAAHQGVSPSGVSASVRQGAKDFQTLGCMGCHRVNGTGGAIGPDLSHEASRDRSRAWLLT